MEEAVTAFRDALKERTREHVPLDWAATQNNLGNALLALGERDTGTKRLEEAVTAFRASLTEWTRERVPLEWAVTQHNLAGVELVLFDKTESQPHLDSAQDYAEQALDVFTQAQASYYVNQTTKRLKAIESRRTPQRESPL